MTRDTDERGKPDPYAMNVTNLRRRSQAVFLACEASVAEDISKAMRWAADEIERLTALRAPAGHAEREALREAAFKLSCHDQFRLATFIAENVGYVLAPEPSFHDEPAAPADTEDQGPDTLGERP